MVQPAATAPASRHVSTRAFSTSSDAIVGERTYQWAAVSRGTMLGRSPALVKMPWMRSVGSMCWRRAATFT
jgi:hypothetical protein